MRIVEHSNRFKRDFKRMKKRGKTIEKLVKVMRLLEEKQPLPKRLKDHSLEGNWLGSRDCHIEPDWILIYSLLADNNVVRFECTGTHSDLF